MTANKGLRFDMRKGVLCVTLPSGRPICYPGAKIGTEYGDGARGDHDIIEYKGINQISRKWETLRTYGGKLAENIVQAIARDILGAVILRAEAAGLRVVFHVHDEIIVDAEPRQTLADVERLFATPPEWADGLPLVGAGYTTPFYLKD